MAKYIFDAESYDLGTDLATLGFEIKASDAGENIVAVDENGQRIFKGVTGTNAGFVDGNAPFGDQEVLTIWNADGVTKNVVTARLRQDLASNYAVYAYWLENGTADGSILTFNYLNAGGTTAFAGVPAPPSILDRTLTYALRLRMEGDVVKIKLWSSTDRVNPAVDEPAAWFHTATVPGAGAGGVLETGYPGVFAYDRFSKIGIATNGDTAPALPPPVAQVATPTNLTVDNITANSARLNWSQG